jgi:hypothetical protein
MGRALLERSARVKRVEGPDFHAHRPSINFKTDLVISCLANRQCIVSVEAKLPFSNILFAGDPPPQTWK